MVPKIKKKFTFNFFPHFYVFFFDCPKIIQSFPFCISRLLDIIVVVSTCEDIRLTWPLPCLTVCVSRLGALSRRCRPAEEADKRAGVLDKYTTFCLYFPYFYSFYSRYTLILSVLSMFERVRNFRPITMEALQNEYYFPLYSALGFFGLVFAIGEIGRIVSFIGI